jgi:hypothetical protein
VSDTMHPDGTETVSRRFVYVRRPRVSYNGCNGLKLDEGRMIWLYASDGMVAVEAYMT